MPRDTPHFDDRGRLIAPKYDDIYFSAEDGLGETRHVFIDGNNLLQRFAAMSPGSCFTIGETGFGTGLNFVEAWMRFIENAPGDAQLEYMSVEAEPLPADIMMRALSGCPAHAGHASVLLKQWGPLWPGVHRFRLEGGRVRLTLLVGEAEDVLSSVDASADAWFLDGFAPSRNPDMWNDVVCRQIARLSTDSATLATYTSAGYVRRGLKAAGFTIEKTPGFLKKREMTVGRLTAPVSSTRLERPEHAVVIGASLAGAFAARALADRGIEVSVYEYAQPVEGELPSLVPRHAVLQPKINDENDQAGRRLREGYAIAERWLRGDEALARRADWYPCGTFQAAHDKRSTRRLRRFVDQFGATGLCRWVDADQTERELGIGLGVSGVVVEQAGALRPAGLCRELLNHQRITSHYGTMVSAMIDCEQGWRLWFQDSPQIEEPCVVVANGVQANIFIPLRFLSLSLIRGQATVLRSARQSGALAGLKRAVFYGGYLMPPIKGMQTLGASFDPDYSESAWRMEEHRDVCDKLARVLPDEARRLASLTNPSGWFGYRTVTGNGRVCAREVEPGLYASLGHGSHGIASAAHAGEHLAALITGGVRHRDT